MNHRSFSLVTALSVFSSFALACSVTTDSGLSAQGSDEIAFLRVKNAWGAARPDGPSLPGMPAYHDLYVDYLDGPVKKCITRDEVTDRASCPTTTTPLQNVVLPSGY